MQADKGPANKPQSERQETPGIVIPIAAKGHRQQFFSDPAIDKVYTMLIALMAEVSVVRERLDVHERLAAQAVVATPEAVNAYLPDSAAEAERNTARQDYLNRIFRVMNEEAERFTKREDPDWPSTIEKVRGDKD